MKNTFFFFTIILFLISCAEIIPPSGGEEDKTAPKVKISNPENGSIFFEGNRIEIKFDEFIKFSNSSENIFITPSLTQKPIFKQIGKKLIISFQEELLPNTTYSITMNESIEDFNEGNKIDIFNYVFSTGSFIDSLKAEGTILNAFDKKPMEKIYVLLYPETEDSILYKKPLYISKTDASGNYKLTNLKAGNYKLAALEDKNLNLIYDQKEEKIAFSTELINISENTSIAPLFLFKNEKDIYIEESKQEANNHYSFIFNKPVEKVIVDVSDFNKENIIEFSPDKKELHYWYQSIDSSSIFYFNINDTYKDTLTKTLELDTNLFFTIETKAYKLVDFNNIEIDFSIPIKDFNLEKLNLFTNSKNKINYKYTWENNNKRLQIETQNTEDTLILKIDSLCFISYDNKENNKLDKTISSFENIKSNLLLKLPPNSSNLILQLINSNNKIIKEQNVSRETLISFNNINIGKYFVRIFNDENENGVWDNGMFHVKQFPEETIFYSTEINVVVNFDKELDIKY